MNRLVVLALLAAIVLMIVLNRQVAAASPVPAASGNLSLPTSPRNPQDTLSPARMPVSTIAPIQAPDEVDTPLSTFVEGLPGSVKDKYPVVLRL